MSINDWRPYSVNGNSLMVYSHGLALQVHANQKRSTGEPYINHLTRVASNVHSMFKGHELMPVLVSAALLHDAVEDGPGDTWERIVELGNIHLTSAIGLLTHDLKINTYEDYVNHIVNSKNNAAVIVKFFDLQDNMTGLEKCPFAMAANLYIKYSKAVRKLKPEFSIAVNDVFTNNRICRPQ